MRFLLINGIRELVAPLLGLALLTGNRRRFTAKLTRSSERGHSARKSWEPRAGD